MQLYKTVKPVSLSIGLMLFFKTVTAQLYIGTGATFRQWGNVQLTLHNTDIINHGNFFPGLGSVLFTGNNNSTISGTQTTVFNDFEINKTNGSVVMLQQLIDIVRNARFTSGNLDLNGNILDLGITGILLGENENSRITGINGGQVLFSTVLNNPSGANPANLGAVITSGQNLGTVLIRRGHRSQVNNYGNGNSILRYYDIVPVNTVPFSATLRINYFDGELNGLTENGLVFWNSSDNLHWTNEHFTLGNTNLNYMEKTGISSFGRWTLSSNNNGLPVIFILFNLKCDEKRILLTWKTAQEQNSSHYTIEKSTDGVSWKAMGTVPAAGNSNTERSYLFTDNNPAQNSYYRIAQFDIDGRVARTNILRSSCIPGNDFSVWPNPFANRIFISVTADRPSGAVIKIFDSKGALVKKQDATVLAGNTQLTVHTGHLPAGAYNLSVEWSAGQINKVIQLLKQ